MVRFRGSADPHTEADEISEIERGYGSSPGNTRVPDAPDVSESWVDAVTTSEILDNPRETDVIGSFSMTSGDQSSDEEVYVYSGQGYRSFLSGATALDLPS